MLECSDGYRDAIVGDTRRIYVKGLINIVSPDIVYGNVQTNSVHDAAQLWQLHDKNFEAARLATLEHNRWVLDGGFGVFPDGTEGTDLQIAYLSAALSGAGGAFENAVWAELPFSGVSVLQACSVYFPDADTNGYPVDFAVEVKQGGTAYFTKEFTGNRDDHVSIEGFTVYNPDAIRVTVARWSMPGRRSRVVEIVPGIYETWSNDMICAFSVTQEVNFACLSLPYGTCTLRMDNQSRRFEPRNKNGVFQSIEERQGIPVSIGVQLEDSTVEYKQIGVYYQFSGGWKTGDNGLSMQWDLVDIVGLLANREFLLPATLPTTLSGWLSCLTGQLGKSFEDKWKCDAGYAGLSVTASADALSGKKCGDILRWICMATGTFPRADATTGYLTAEPLWSAGNRLTLDNLDTYPVMKANDDLAAILFRLSDGTELTVSGGTTASSNTVSVDNPFLHTQTAALTAAKAILGIYGGNQIETVGRGDMASELGDVDQVQLNESTATSARRFKQEFSFSDGVLKNCQSVLLQPDGAFQFQERIVITESGTWTAPTGVTKLRIILVGGGEPGGDGTNGSFEAAGEQGADGVGGKVYAATISINDGQTFDVSIGAGGVPGGKGGTTIFGAYSSESGSRYDGYTDIQSGDVFSRTGVAVPLPGSGDGGAGGAGGTKGYRHEESWKTEWGGGTHWVVDNEPGTGEQGVSGASGCVVVYWDKEES